MLQEWSTRASDDKQKGSTTKTSMVAKPITETDSARSRGIPNTKQMQETHRLKENKHDTENESTHISMYIYWMSNFVLV